MNRDQIRDPQGYAVLFGTDYDAVESWDRVAKKSKVTLWAPCGRVPEGFRFPQSESDTRAYREVGLRDLDRFYEIRITCMYSGGGPFKVLRLDRREDDVWLNVLYEGDNRKWALAQPRIESDEGRRRAREPDIEGWIPLSEAEFVQQVEVDLIKPKHRRKVTKPNKEQQ